VARNSISFCQKHSLNEFAVDGWQIPSNWGQAATTMELAELALASCCKMKGLMIVGLSIGAEFGGADTDGSGAFELCSLLGCCENRSPGCCWQVSGGRDR